MNVSTGIHPDAYASKHSARICSAHARIDNSILIGTEIFERKLHRLRHASQQGLGHWLEQDHYTGEDEGCMPSPPPPLPSPSHHPHRGMYGMLRGPPEEHL